MLRRSTLALSLAALAATPFALAQDRVEKVQNDVKELAGDDYWIYNDLDRGIAEAKRRGKPMLVVFRCIL